MTLHTVHFPAVGVAAAAAAAGGVNTDEAWTWGFIWSQFPLLLLTQAGLISRVVQAELLMVFSAVDPLRSDLCL